MNTQMIDTALSVAEKINTVLEHSHTRFYERRDASLALATALASGTHMIMFGKPGTTKTALGNYFAQSMGVQYYYQQLNGSTQEESLFGPISMKGIQDDIWTRKWAGLANAHIAFCDEIGKASNLVQNQLLGAMQERKISIADTTHKLPLHTMISGSNETIDENPALYDRWTIRVLVNQIQDMDNFAAMLVSKLDPHPTPVDPNDLPTLRCITEHMAETASQEVIQKIVQLRTQIVNQTDHYISDRRWKACLRVAAGQALLDGSDTIRVTDLHTAKWLLWDNAELKAIQGVYDFVERITNEDLMKLREFSLLVDELEKEVGKLTVDSDGTVQGNALNHALKLQQKVKKFSGKQWEPLRQRIAIAMANIMALSEMDEIKVT